MATFGKTSIGTNEFYDGQWRHKEACRFQALETGTLTEITWYGGAERTPVYIAIYSDSNGAPDALLGSGPVDVGAALNWWKLTGLSVPIAAGAYYWLAVNNGDFAINSYYDAGVTNQFMAQVEGADTPPPGGTFGSGTYYDYEMSIYATYTPAGPTPLQILVTPESASLQTNQQQTFTATVSGGVYPYAVSWIDRATNEVLGQGTSLTIAFASAGNYVIFARVTDAENTTVDSQDIPITVAEPLQTHRLTVDSTPIQGIPFTIKRVS